MIAPVHLLLVADEAEDELPRFLAEPLKRAGYSAHFSRVTSVESIATAMAERQWDAVLVGDPPDGLTAVDLLAWLERCRASTPVIALSARPEEEDLLRQAGVAEVLPRGQWHGVGLALARARRAAAVPEGTSFRTLASKVPVALYRLGPDGRLLYANPAMARILCADSPEAVLARHLNYDFGFPRDAFTAQMTAAGEVNDLLISWRKQDGESVLLRETAWPRRDSTGAVICFEGMIEVLPLPAEPPLHPNSSEKERLGPQPPRVAAAPHSEPFAARSAPTRPSADRDPVESSAENSPAPAPGPNGGTSSIPGGDGSLHLTVAAPPEETAAAPRRSMLILEDNTEARQLLQRILKPYFQVDGVGDAQAALEHMKRQRYDVLLLDIHLGGKQSGADVLRIARTLPGYADALAIAITAYALPGDRDSILSAGFDAYVSKPFTVQALLETLGETRVPARRDR